MNLNKINNTNSLHPNWITGFTDAEGCFSIFFTKSKKSKNWLEYTACFQIMLHIKDKDLLLKIKSFFNEVGYINHNNNIVIYRVYKLKDIIGVIIPHFNNYPLITQKQSDFIIFKEIVSLMFSSKKLDEKIVNKI